MRFIYLGRLLVLPLVIAHGAFGAPAALIPANASIGKDLQTSATVALSEPAADTVEINLTSKDPSRLLLAKTPDALGTASITLKVRARFRESPEFWLQALGGTGEVKYEATAVGYSSGIGTATLTASGITIVGPLGDHSAPEFVTTTRGWPTKITLHTVRLTDSLDCAEPQYVRGGISLDVDITSSQSSVGIVAPEAVTIAAANDTAVAHFRPARAGKTSLSVRQPTGLHIPAKLNAVLATVRSPGIAVAKDMIIGENLQVAAALSLGEPAPEGGLNVTLRSRDPKLLLLSARETEVGKPSIQIHIPAGAVSATYYLQALSDSGVVAHSASAPGYVERTGTLTLAPSGIILCLEKHGPPDEAELFRPESAGSHRNQLVALLSESQPTPLTVYTAYLDPATRRSADITVQQLRAGLSLTVDLLNTNSEIGSVESKAVIKGGADSGKVAFRPARVGETVISVLPPKGFTKPSNATEILVVVRN